MAKIKFGNIEETVITHKEFSIQKAREILNKETISIIGYGVQGPAQALNLRDNGIKNVIVGQRKESKSWNKAILDGWNLARHYSTSERRVKEALLYVICYLMLRKFLSGNE